MMRRAWPLLCLLGFWVGLLCLLTGCATTDEPGNESARPWNAPQSWEHGLPMGIGEQRR